MAEDEDEPVRAVIADEVSDEVIEPVTLLLVHDEVSREDFCFSFISVWFVFDSLKAFDVFFGEKWLIATRVDVEDEFVFKDVFLAIAPLLIVLALLSQICCFKRTFSA